MRRRITRRRFLEESMLAAAAAAAGPVTLRAVAAGRRRGEDPVRIGVVGVRGRGRGHIGAFKDSPDSTVVAICDPDEGVIGPAMRAVPDARYYRDIRAMLDQDDIDAVAIATPNHWHSLATI
ncbi:MAG: Gfo/Idh/MocA family oxidoreductase, partial [Planctomycetota bacterium]